MSSAQAHGSPSVAWSAIHARRTRGGTRAGIIAPNKAKTPDFIMRFQPMFPPVFQTVTKLNPNISFGRWPVESKAAGTVAQARVQIRKALQQLGTYWYERYPYEPSVCGYGIAICLVYRHQPRRMLRIHVFVPSNQVALQAKIAAYRQAKDRVAFLAALRTTNSPVRGDMHALD
jgi:hypothetical protein